MEFRHLRYFVVLAEELHFGRAAHRLAMSQPPLSVAIVQLEVSVGAQLFTRNSKSVQLTAAGHAFVPQAKALLAQAQQAARHARDVAQGVAGSLQVGFVGTMLYCGLPPTLKQFQALYPRLRISLKELSSSDQLVELGHERLDAGFVHTTRVPQGLSQILVASQPFVACLPAKHRLAGHRSVSLASLAGEPFACVSRSVSADYHEKIVSLCVDAGFAPQIEFELRHWLSVVSLVSQGLGVALVPRALAQSALPGAVFLPLEGVDAPYDTYCLWKTGRDHSALQMFLEAVRGAARS